MRSRKMNVRELQRLAAKVASGKASAAEQQFLDAYYDLFDTRENEPALTNTEATGLHESIKARLSETLIRQSVEVAPHTNWYAIAATLTLFVLAGFGLYKLVYQEKTSQLAAVVKPQQAAAPIVPGGTKAMLTLANGTRIALDDKTAGTLARQAGVKITKTADGQLIYESLPSAAQAGIEQYNTMETPRGGIYQVYLPDGTHVWLNSETKLKYPVAFKGAERRVELTGEAYFEVAHNAHMPFRVVSNNQEIEVLGTHFNVMAYADEQSSRTTLLQGSVKVTATISGASKTIVPGQQAVLRQTGIQLHNVDAENAIAWKTGLFRFDNESVTTIMKKIARWYDVEVVYKDDVSDMRFGGTVSRFTDIHKVLSKLELTNTINFKIEGRRIIVMR